MSVWEGKGSCEVTSMRFGCDSAEQDERNTRFTWAEEEFLVAKNSKRYAARGLGLCLEHCI